MLGQFFSENEAKYNVIVLAGGLGTRMGSASDHIPKALTRIGSQRAIDLILSKFLLIGHRFIIGTAWHSDLLESYVRGRFGSQPIFFSQEIVSDLKSNAVSMMYALDMADSRVGTIVTFCDLLLLSNPAIGGSALYLATRETKGVVGTFRHSAKVDNGKAVGIIAHEGSQPISAIENGVVGFFVFENTVLLKEIVYSCARTGKLGDMTADIVSRYIAVESTKAVPVDALLEFGTETDLTQARKAWEKY